jgi:predicted Zn-dependent protease
MKKLWSIAILSISVLLFISCNKVPLTGRKQMNLLSESTLLQMSREQYGSVLQQERVVENTEDAKMVKRVGQSMATSVEVFLKENGYKNRVDDFEWEFNLIESNQVNAWCMPGGKVAFYTGILPITADETGLAVVMGHEIAHAVARHGNERMSQSLMLSLGGIALSVALSEKPEETRNIFLTAYGVGASVGVVLPFSRKNELEADKLGLVFMKLAGYDVNQAVDFWKRMAQNGASVPEFLSTHPSDETRVSEIEAFINSVQFKSMTKGH